MLDAARSIDARVDWAAVELVLREAYMLIAPKSLAVGRSRRRRTDDSILMLN